ncbi:hypothetical protein [Streptomyces tritici]|uniref:hypothetical protein n=1 Tax=Streptomyces tritici TaxID=2054410 RepID=UPI003AEF75D4
MHGDTKDAPLHRSERKEHPDPGLWAVYLRDHLTGAAAGTALMRRIARAHRGAPEEPRLRRLAQETREDQRSLRACMAQLGVRPSRGRIALGLLAERAGRLKRNGRVLRRSPLSDVVELEAMRMGVEGKAACWRALGTLARTDPRLDPDHLDHLVRRARRQARTLEAVRSDCVARLAVDGGPVTA